MARLMCLWRALELAEQSLAPKWYVLGKPRYGALHRKTL